MVSTHFANNQDIQHLCVRKNSDSPKIRKFSAVSDLTDGSSTVCSAYSSSFMESHLFTRLKQRVNGSTVIIGHRGGFFGPENSMKGFRGAIENKLEGIEFDVSRIFTSSIDLYKLTYFTFRRSG